MTSMLQLPRELYLMICLELTPTELTRLAGVNRDHYLAVQHPLFTRVNLHSFTALVKLVRTLTKAPIVSHISAKQRLHWHKLSDEQLREREIKQLSLTLNCRNEGDRINGATFERLIAALARRCVHVEISLTLNGVWRDFTTQLSSATVPAIKQLAVYLGVQSADTVELWKLAFGGEVFPDLSKVCLNALATSGQDMASSPDGGISTVLEQYDESYHYSGLDAGINCFQGLLNMEEIKLELSTSLNAKILRSLFGSSTIPKRLTKLEIVNCPGLDPVRDLEALATLLQRTLQLLQFLKLHLVNASFDSVEHCEAQYVSKINEYPEHHLCNVIRELGQGIKNLDLAVPYACNRVLVPPARKVSCIETLDLPMPSISATPLNTLPQRLVDSGYRYRSLIFDAPCRGEHKWEDMAGMASDQGDMISWDIASQFDHSGVWCVSGCVPLEYELHEDGIKSYGYHQ